MKTIKCYDFSLLTDPLVPNISHFVQTNYISKTYLSVNNFFCTR